MNLALYTSRINSDGKIPWYKEICLARLARQARNKVRAKGAPLFLALTGAKSDRARRARQISLYQEILPKNRTSVGSDLRR